MKDSIQQIEERLSRGYIEPLPAIKYDQDQIWNDMKNLLKLVKAYEANGITKGVKKRLMIQIFGGST